MNKQYKILFMFVVLLAIISAIWFRASADDELNVSYDYETDEYDYETVEYDYGTQEVVVVAPPPVVITSSGSSGSRRPASYLNPAPAPVVSNVTPVDSAALTVAQPIQDVSSNAPTSGAGSSGPSTTTTDTPSTPSAPSANPTSTENPIEKDARDLSYGITGEDVRALQIYLNSQGFTLATEGAGSPGNETTFFGPLTRAALTRFQESNGIAESEYGFFGSSTRTFIGQ